MSIDETDMNQVLLGEGVVRHNRLRPVQHAFDYRTYFVMLPLRSLRGGTPSVLPRGRWGLMSFADQDHGDGRADCLSWVEELLRSQGIEDADGEVWLQCFPRVLGFAFKPVSFWYCHRADNSLAAIVVEVNNTFGERHCYLLSGPELAFGAELRASKVFHVSPFCEVRGQYRFRFLRSFGAVPRVMARVDHDDLDGPLLQTSVSGKLAPYSASAARRLFVSMPWMTLGVVIRIHWQALRLWLKHVPFFTKPAPPRPFVSR